eukprot:6171999-Pleurochrysis_carterae.AAC.3
MRVVVLVRVEAAREDAHGVLHLRLVLGRRDEPEDLPRGQTRQRWLAALGVQPFKHRRNASEAAGVAARSSVFASIRFKRCVVRRVFNFRGRIVDARHSPELERVVLRLREVAPVPERVSVVIRAGAQ